MTINKIIPQELARLAKRKGFNPVVKTYYPFDYIYEHSEADKEFKPNEGDGYAAPMFSILLEWLKNWRKANIIVIPRYCYSEKGNEDGYNYYVKYEVRIYTINRESIQVEKFVKLYETEEKAYKEAICTILYRI